MIDGSCILSVLVTQVLVTVDNSIVLLEMSFAVTGQKVDVTVSVTVEAIQGRQIVAEDTSALLVGPIILLESVGKGTPVMAISLVLPTATVPLLVTVSVEVIVLGMTSVIRVREVPVSETMFVAVLTNRLVVASVSTIWLVVVSVTVRLEV